MEHIFIAQFHLHSIESTNRQQNPPEMPHTTRDEDNDSRQNEEPWNCAARWKPRRDASKVSKQQLQQRRDVAARGRKNISNVVQGLLKIDMKTFGGRQSFFAFSCVQKLTRLLRVTFDVNKWTCVLAYVCSFHLSTAFIPSKSQNKSWKYSNVAPIKLFILLIFLSPMYLKI